MLTYASLEDDEAVSPDGLASDCLHDRYQDRRQGRGHLDPPSSLKDLMPGLHISIPPSIFFTQKSYSTHPHRSCSPKNSSPQETMALGPAIIPMIIGLTLVPSMGLAVGLWDKERGMGIEKRSAAEYAVDGAAAVPSLLHFYGSGMSAAEVEALHGGILEPHEDGLHSVFRNGEVELMANATEVCSSHFDLASACYCRPGGSH